MKQTDLLAAIKELSAPVKQMIVLTALAVGVTVAWVFLVLMPQISGTTRLTETVEAENKVLTQMYTDISAISDLRTSVAEREARLEGLKNSGVLEPLLGSYEMRALRQVGPLAIESGVNVLPDSVRCTTQLPILPGTSITGTLYKRQVIEFSGSGSYAQIVHLIRAIEENLPLVSVSSLRILSQRTPEEHAVLLALEWPVVAANTDAEAAKGRKRR